MTIFIDLIGSTIVRASMVVVMLGLILTLSSALYKSTITENTSTHLATVQEMIQSDLTKLVPNGIDTWRTNQYRITFWAYKDSTMTSSSRIAYIFSEGKLYRSVDFVRYSIADDLVVDNNGLFSYQYENSKISSIRTKLCMAIVSDTDTTYISNEFKVSPTTL
jgi:hypothetical protein